MLSRTSIDDFLRLLRCAQTTAPAVTSLPTPSVSLRAPTTASDSWRRTEIHQLWQSTRIAHGAGDIPELPAHILFSIKQDFSEESDRCLSLSHEAEWTSAIQWALEADNLAVAQVSARYASKRELRVGAACTRLRARGYKVPITAYGPDLDASTQTIIASRINSWFCGLGGRPVVRRLLKRLTLAGRWHNGIWLFGDFVTSTDEFAEPKEPVGWLLSLAIRHIHAAPTSSRYEHDFQDAIALAVDFAGCLNCQRYSTFDDFNPDAVDFPRLLAESVLSRELFSVPQVPPSSLLTLLQAAETASWPDGASCLRDETIALFTELGALVDRVPADDLGELFVQSARRDFPLLYRYAHAAPGKANAQYLEPFERGKRTHESCVFFETTNHAIVTLPRTMTAACGVRMIFERIYRSGVPTIEHFVGQLYEQSVVLACRDKVDRLWQSQKYSVGKATFEFDLVTQTGLHVVCFEVKSKTLKEDSRAGDVPSMLADYAKSYLALLVQLLRHERYLREGKTPITTDGEEGKKLDVTKVAVSPISFGPISDKVLATALTEGILLNRLSLHATGSPQSKLFEEFNALVNEAGQQLDRLVQLSQGKHRPISYLMSVIWLDLGQLLYLVDRATTLDKRGTLFRGMSFMTRDFWTEIALADRQSERAAREERERLRGAAGPSSG